MYDLTSLLTTIAGSSATIAAIVGGFIASRLIALNTERIETTSRILEIEQELAFRNNEVDKANAELMEDDALDFIIDHMEEALSAKPLESVYVASERPSLSKEELEPYWNKALEVIYNFAKVFSSKNINKDFNSDGIPSDLAADLENFEYTICDYALRYIEKKQKHKAPYTGLVYGNFVMPRIKGYWYQKARDDMNVHVGHLEWLEVQKSQLQNREEALKRPKGVVSGLVTFFILVLVGVVMPLTEVPFSTENYSLFFAKKKLYIELFSICLLLVFLYFISLLRWRQSD